MVSVKRDITKAQAITRLSVVTIYYAHCSFCTFILFFLFLSLFLFFLHIYVNFMEREPSTWSLLPFYPFLPGCEAMIFLLQFNCYTGH